MWTRKSFSVHSDITPTVTSSEVVESTPVSRDNAEALARMIDTAVAQGYAFRTLDDYFKKRLR